MWGTSHSSCDSLPYAAMASVAWRLDPCPCVHLLTPDINCSPSRTFHWSNACIAQVQVFVFGACFLLYWYFDGCSLLQGVLLKSTRLTRERYVYWRIPFLKHNCLVQIPRSIIGNITFAYTTSNTDIIQ